MRNEEGPPREPFFAAPPPDTSPPLLARKIAPTRMRGNTATVNGSKVPYSLSAVAPPVRQETCGCVDNVRQFWSEQGSQPIHRSRRLRGSGGSEASVREVGKRAHLEFYEFDAISEGDRRRRHAHLAIPVAEDDCGRFGMPRGAEVLVATSDIGEEHAIRALRPRPEYAPCRGRPPA